METRLDGQILFRFNQFIKSFHQEKVETFEVLSLDDVKDSIRNLSKGKPRETIKAGAILKLNMPNQTYQRIYIGIFDNTWTCIAATQLLAIKFANELEQEFNSNDLIIFSDESVKHK